MQGGKQEGALDVFAVEAGHRDATIGGHLPVNDQALASASMPCD
jgi:hypothetical protein